MSTVSHTSFITRENAPLGLSPIELEQEIHRLRSERKAVILAHYYQDEHIQDLADFIGDSLELSRKAAATDAEMIVFCGVRFMAEVAKILSPNKTVVLPDMKAGCSLEESCPPEKFRAFCEARPDHLVISYINCSAEVKALSDIIVTSSNAEAILNQLPADQKIIFGPDKHLGAYLAAKTGRSLVLWPGACIVHDRFSTEQLVKLKTRNPDAVIIAHPECPASLLAAADYVGSTSGLLRYVATSPAPAFIVATEEGMLHQLRKAAPGKAFFVAPGSDGTCHCATCPYMKLNTTEKLYLALRDVRPEIVMDEGLRLGALKPLQRMLAMSPPAGVV
jgi:quinolinate synthase